MAESKTYPERMKLWIFPNTDKKKSNHPDWQGPGSITKVALKELVDAYKEHGDGETLNLRCAGWNRTSKKGGQYNFVTIEPEVPREVAKQEPDDVPF